MLRITIHDEPEALTFQLEGKLGGQDVPVLAECWRSVVTDQRERILRVDLTEVTSIDAAGLACLSLLHRQGAEFIAADCLTKALVDEINQGNGCDPPSDGQVEGRRSRWTRQ